MKQIIVQSASGASKVALLEDERLVEFHIEQPAESRLAGNIYKGRIINVLPGMQAAFVDIGLKKNAFLYVDDLLPAHLDKQPAVKPCISELAKEGQELLVQIKKEPVGNKGARITTHLTIPGRWCVLMPQAGYVAVSRKIEKDAERQRLKKIGETMRRGEDGLIIRTVAEGESEEGIGRDVDLLYKLWESIAAKAEASRAPSHLYLDLELIPRLVRDLFDDRVDEIVLDDPSLANALTDMLRQSAPGLAERIKIYAEPAPLFQAFGIDGQLSRSFGRSIPLDNGGYLVVDRTEALTVIDVNTGKYVGDHNLEQTVFETNLAAAEEIARLTRLRDWGGILLVDFIDMLEEQHRERIVERLEEALRRDRNKALVVGWTRLGLLEMTRKKVRQPLDLQLLETCACCEGRGQVPSKLYPLK